MISVNVKTTVAVDGGESAKILPPGKYSLACIERNKLSKSVHIHDDFKIRMR